MDDVEIVTWQLGRAPRGRWRTVSRCRFGFPVVIATAPALDGGVPFPTLFYLTCPQLVAEVSALESRGVLAYWRERLADDPALVSVVSDADVAYRRARAAEAGGDDPCEEVGLAGQRDPGALKCLHAHVAAFMGGIDDPIGRDTLLKCEAECGDRRCEGAR